jgi:hypothetical protein
MQKVSIDGFRVFQSTILFQTGDTSPEKIKNKIKISLILINPNVEKGTIFTRNPVPMLPLLDGQNPISAKARC